MAADDANEAVGAELVECIRDKYEGGGLENTSLTMPANTGRSEMKWEFVQMDKVHKAQSNIYALKCIVLTESGISHVSTTSGNGVGAGRKFPKCTELDLSTNAVSSWWRLAEILELFPELRTLRLSKNPLSPIADDAEFRAILDVYSPLHCTVRELSLNCCQFGEAMANRVLALFPQLEELYLANNGLSAFLPSIQASAVHLKRLDLQGNPIVHFERIWPLGKLLPALEFLNLSECQLARIRLPTMDSASLGFPKLDTLFLQYNAFSDWQSIDELARLPALTKLMLKGVLLPGAKGMDSREMIIAKMPNLLVLDRCDISPAARRSAELLFLSRLGSLPASDVVEHQTTLVRLQRVHDFAPNPAEAGSRRPITSSTSVQSVRLKLVHAGRVLERDVSVQLSIHKLVGLASALFDFDNGDVHEVEIRRKNGYPVERLRRLAANLLRQFDLEDDDAIAFV